MKVMGILGKAGSGKDTAADYLARNYGMVKVAWADPLKRICRDVFNFPVEKLWGPSEYREIPDSRYSRNRQYSMTDSNGITTTVRHIDYLTPREALRTLGTEWGRARYDKIWVEYGIRIASELLANPFNWYDPYRGLTRGMVEAKKREWVLFSDTRFRNEFEAIKENGGKVIRIIRPEVKSTSTHQSETEQDEIQDSELDAVIENSGTLEELYAKLDEVMESFREEGNEEHRVASRE